MAARVPITPEGVQKLKDELKKLKTVDRPGIMAAIEEAKGHGDLSENAEYHAAKEKQGLIELRIREVEDKLARVEVIDPAKMSGDRVVFGARVTVRDEDSGEEATYQLVGDDEADIKNGRLSISSPLARGLIGKEVGDACEVRTPKGQKEYSIVRIGFLQAS
jgi:transcription elongation factor GreA